MCVVISVVCDMLRTLSRSLVYVLFYIVLLIWYRGLSLFFFFFFPAEEGIRDLVPSRGVGNVYKGQDIL